MEILDIVNEHDCVVGTCDRKESYRKCLRNRTVIVMIRNSQGKFAVQRRSSTCSFMPGWWDSSACGHVSSGQTYEQAAQRELFEEIGVQVPLVYLWTTRWCRNKDDSKYLYDPSLIRGTSHEYFCGVFEGIHDGEFILDDGEVDEVAWMSIEEIDEMVAKKEAITPGLLRTLDLYYR